MGGEFSKKQIRKAGDNLAAGFLSGDERLEALRIVGYWRAAHMEPLRKTLSMLEGVCGQDNSTILVSRLKRIDSIIEKLSRPGHAFNLDTLGDIAGCRLIVRTNDDASRIANTLRGMGYHRVKDYMAAPKESGYRGIHVMCRNDADSYGYKNLDVEVQVRTLKQHGWATAVEIYDLITGASLKSGGGTQEQKRFFQLASELMNDDSANTATAIAELKALDDKLGVLSTLREATDSMYFVHDGDIEISRSDSCLVAVDLGVQQISIEIFSSDNESEAADRYTELESTEEEGFVYLLARAGSLDDLRHAYPNYYSDISAFVDWLEDCIG